MVEFERIYVGGVDPPRLTVQELMSRIVSDVKDKVEIRDTAISSIYCHFNAASLQPGVSALETIRKLYNNVKWKGCKIKVEAAKPHYLERLAKERAERLIASEEKEDLPGREPVPIPRHLKIRRGYGEESWKVDTKPCEVSDWSTFRKMRTRLIQKQSQVREKKNQTVRTSAWNRAVLLRFKETEGAFAQRLKHPLSLDQSESQSESDDSDSEGEVSLNGSSSSSSAGSLAKKNDAEESGKKNGTYVWSDSSDDEADLDEGRSDSLHVKAMIEEKNEELIETKSSQEQIVSSKLDEHKEDSSSLEQGEENISANDVQINLNILAQIFPDLEGKKPHSGLDKNEAAVGKGGSDTKKGWTEMGQMVRFDPTQLSSEKFIVEPSISGSVTEDEEREMKDGDDDSAGDKLPCDQEEEELNIESAANQDNAPGKIYEQQKLEEVFKATREQESLESKNRITSAPIQSGAFSFSFQVPESKDKVAETIVQVPFTSAEAKSQELVLKNQAETMEREQEEPKKKRIRRGLTFPEKDLDAYVAFFYSQNDGSRIMSKGLAAYREDPQVHAAWVSQRRILTQDWRRKHKYAVAQKRKRFGR